MVGAGYPLEQPLRGRHDAPEAGQCGHFRMTSAGVARLEIDRSVSA